MKQCTLFLLLFLSTVLIGQPNIAVENVTVSLQPDNKLSITYDLLYASNDLAEVTFRATQKGGLTFDFNTENATGAVGSGVGSGTGLQIEWDYSDYAPIDEFRLMLVARLNQPVDIQALVNQVDSNRLLADLTFLEGVRHRSGGPTLLADTRLFIESQFLDAGLETSILDVPLGVYVGKNIVGRQIGTSDEEVVYILDGHYDSVSNSPGADDNASAVAGMIEALRVLSPYSFKKSIRYIGFDLEEAGLVGSAEYVDNQIAPSESIAGVLNFEMIGYYTEEPNSQSTPVGFGFLFPKAYAMLEANDFRGDFINLIGNEPANSLMTAYESAITNYVPDLKSIRVTAPSNWFIIAPDLGRSDHAPFWLENIPAVMLTDGSEFRYPHYHTPQDTKEKLNYTFMRQVVQAAVATLAEVCEIQNADTWWADTDFTTSTQEVAGCDFSISPNPAHDFLRLTWAGCQMVRPVIELINLKGQLVRKQTLPTSAGNMTQFDVRGLEKGIYFVKIKHGNGHWAKKVVIN